MAATVHSLEIVFNKIKISLHHVLLILKARGEILTYTLCKKNTVIRAYIEYTDYELGCDAATAVKCDKLIYCTIPIAIQNVVYDGQATVCNDIPHKSRDGERRNAIRRMFRDGCDMYISNIKDIEEQIDALYSRGDGRLYEIIRQIQEQNKLLAEAFNDILKSKTTSD